MNDAEYKKLLEEAMKSVIPPSPWDALNQQLGYDKAFQAEVNDGLIALDFRTISVPSFMSWIDENRRFSDDPFQKNGIAHKKFHFDWSFRDTTLGVVFHIIIWDDYNLAHEDFRARIEAIVSSKTKYFAWRPCKKSIGTTCARTSTSAVFAYKNVVVSIETRFFFTVNHQLHNAINAWADEALVPKSPNGEPWDMVFAEWVFNILKTAPRFKEFPAEPKPR